MVRVFVFIATRLQPFLPSPTRVEYSIAHTHAARRSQQLIPLISYFKKEKTQTCHPREIQTPKSSLETFEKSSLETFEGNYWITGATDVALTSARRLPDYCPAVPTAT